MKYNEIFRLKAMLENAGIQYVFRPCFDGYQICYPSSKDRICSVIEHDYSYGNEKDRLEIMGLLTVEEKECDEVVGYLTAENVFERISKDWNK